MKMKNVKKTLSDKRREVNFQDIDRQLLEGFECSQYDIGNKRFLSMIREQTNSAIDNKKYWNTNC